MVAVYLPCIVYFVYRVDLVVAKLRRGVCAVIRMSENRIVKFKIKLRKFCKFTIKRKASGSKE